MADWIFQGSPREHDLDARIAASPERWWGTPRYRDRMAAGDHVWVQVTGPHHPGIYYLATILSATYEHPLQPGEPTTPGGGRTSGSTTASGRPAAGDPAPAGRVREVTLAPDDHGWSWRGVPAVDQNRGPVEQARLEVLQRLLCPRHRVDMGGGPDVVTEGERQELPPVLTGV
jgi:hypothetical protein